MIIVSFMLVLLGLVTLLLGILGVGDQPMQFIYVSIASSLVAAVLLIVGIFRAKPAPAGSSSVPAGATTWSGSVQGAGGVVPPEPKPDEPTTQLSDLDDASSPEAEDDTENIATVFPEHSQDEPAVVDDTAWAPPDEGKGKDGEGGDEPPGNGVDPGDDEADEELATADERDVAPDGLGEEESLDGPGLDDPGLDDADPGEPDPDNADVEVLDEPDEDDEPVEDVREDGLDAAELEDIEETEDLPDEALDTADLEDIEQIDDGQDDPDSPEHEGEQFS